MATIQRSYNVPLRRGFRETARWKRTKKAMAVLREFLQQHTKREDVKIGMRLNEYLWRHGIKNPPHHVKVDVWIEDDVAKAELSGFTFKDAVKTKKKEETGGLKEKIQRKFGVKKKEDKDEKEEEKKEEKGEDKGKEDKKGEKEKESSEQKEKKPAADKTEKKPAKKEPKKE